jgi:exopolysaccharide production protein ExoQ
MSPHVAAFVYALVIVWLFRRDIRAERRVTRALWIPIIWLTICSTRFVSQWLAIFGLELGGSSVEEGSPLDALVFLVLIGSGLHVLNQRRVSLVEVIRHNQFLAFFFAYCCLSILWCDFPFVAVKRLLKDMGHPIMVLILLTEPDPEEAMSCLVKRCAFVCVPISILFIKYFPYLGRGYDDWNGAVSYFGVTLGKNTLGLDCFIMGSFLFWYLRKVWQKEKSKERRNELILVVAFLGLIGYLIHIAQSSTSLVSFLIAVAFLIFLNFRWVNPRYLTAYLLGAVFIGFVAQEVFGVYTGVLHLLGKDSTLTDRTYVWNDLLAMKTNPILGVGFENFWLGDRIKPLWAKWNWHPNEAHNGYLETYLDLGLIGLGLFLGLFFTCYHRARRDMLQNNDWGRYRLALLVAVIFYNWTEVPFRATNPIWFYFFLVLMDYPNPHSVGTELSPVAENADGMAVIDLDHVEPVRFGTSTPADYPTAQHSGGSTWPSVLGGNIEPFVT